MTRQTTQMTTTTTMATAAAPGPASPTATYESILAGLARADERLVVLTAENRAAIRNLPAQLGDRFVDVGICEQTMVGMAAGFALRGRVPVVHALATFLTLRAFEFIRTDVGIGGLPVKLVGGVPGLLSEANGPTHQALDDLAVMRAIPGMAIVCPADEDELCAALPSVIAAPGPVYVRHNARRAGDLVHEPFVLGRAEQLVEGKDIGILALGLLVPEAVAAARRLAKQGLSVGVTNLRSLVPVDEEAVVAAARGTSLLVTIEDHFLVGGVYQVVTEILVRRGMTGVRVLPIGLDGRFFAPGLLADVMEHEGLNAARLAERIFVAWGRVQIGDRVTASGPRASAPSAQPAGENTDYPASLTLSRGGPSLV